MKLLIVDDEVKFLDVLKDYLTLQGHEVWGAGTGEEALTLLQQHQPAVCLLDLGLKGKLSGQEVLPEAKRLSPKTQVVIITGDDNAAAGQLQQLGADAFLKKPLRLEDLDQLIATLTRSA